MESFDGFVHGVAFGDAAEVEAHAFDWERGGVVGGVEVEFLVANACAGDIEEVFPGEFFLSSCPAPEAGIGADGDIEGAAGEGGELLGLLEDIEEFGAEFLGLAGS